MNATLFGEEYAMSANRDSLKYISWILLSYANNARFLLIKELAVSELLTKYIFTLLVKIYRETFVKVVATFPPDQVLWNLVFRV